MSLKERVISKIKYRKQRIEDGNINSIPSPFVRFRSDFLGVEQAKYYLITSNTKGAKTQFASYVFIYNTLLYAYYHSNQCTVNIFYYPLEETSEDIMTRFSSYILNYLSNNKIRISPTDLMSSDNNKPVDSTIIELLESDEYNDILDYFEEHIIFSTSSNPTGMYNECKNYAKEHGTIYYKDQKIKDNLTGETKTIKVFDYYVPNDENTYNIIFTDHVSLLSTERGMSLKQTIDKFSEYSVILRNRYKFTPVVIQQQAMAGEGLDAFKENKIRPTIANLADSKYTARDCNVCIGLFSPFKYELTDYKGYDIRKLRDNVRFIEVLVNRGGIMGGLIALYFDGAVSQFKELPLPNNIEINKVYEFIKNRDNINNNGLAFLTISINTKINNIIGKIKDIIKK